MADIPSLADDPCGRAAALRAIRDQVMAGAAVVEGEQHSANGASRRMRFSAANVAMLTREIMAAEAACSGGKPRQFAIGGRF